MCVYTNALKRRRTTNNNTNAACQADGHPIGLRPRPLLPDRVQPTRSGSGIICYMFVCLFVVLLLLFLLFFCCWHCGVVTVVDIGSRCLELGFVVAGAAVVDDIGSGCLVLGLSVCSC